MALLRRKLYLNSWISGALLLLFAACAQGAVFTIDAGTLTASRFISGSGGEQFDVRGAVLVTGPQGSAGLVDSTNGTDPNFLTLAFGNNTLTGLNSGLTQAITLTFDFANPLIGPNAISLTATGTPLFPNPTTDPALIQLLGNTVFTFDLTHLSDLGGGNFLATYTLTGAGGAVPEPQSVGLVALAASALFAVRRRLSARS